MRGIRAAAALVAFAACHGKSAPLDGPADARLEGFDMPDIVASGGGTDLSVGAGKRAYTPSNFETYTDLNGDHKWETNEPYNDLNGNGKFDGVWLFGGARAAEGVTTDVEARALAFVQGQVTIVIVYVDCIGLLVGDMDNIRQHPMLAGLNITHVIVGATHAHDAPDTVGLWGPDPFTTGREDFVINALYDAAAGAIYDAVTSAKPATMQIASTLLINDPSNKQGLTDKWNKDIRDPVIFDPTLTIARFVDASDPNTTIGTLVNWADHPEVAHFSSDVATVTAHYPHYLRDAIENGVTAATSVYAAQDLAGVGGITVFVQGALGGQIGSLSDHQVYPPGPGGVPVMDDSDAKEQAIGNNVGAKALTALQSAESVGELPLSIVSAKFYAQMQNTLLDTAYLIHLLGPHPVAGYDPNQPIDVGNYPWMPLRSTYVQIGPLGIVTVPGELHPELWVGGYDQSWTWGYQFYDATKPNPPNFAEAPQPPYMRDLVLAKPGVRYPVVAGLAEDYIGYIVPAYNYVLDSSDPYITQAAGDHYEEEYSLSPLVEEHAIHPVLQLLQWQP